MARKILKVVLALFLGLILAIVVIFIIGMLLGIWKRSETEKIVTETFGDYTYTVLDDDTVKIDEYSGSAAELTVPSELNGRKVSVIGYNAFFGHTELTSVVIPEGVACMEDFLFVGCMELTSVSLPASLNDLYVYTFHGCGKLNSIEVAPANSSYSSEDGVLYNADKTMLIRCPMGKEDVTVPESVAKIKFLAFDGCKALTGITIPKGVTEIGSDAFENCKSLESIDVDPDNGSYASEDGVLYNADKTTLIRCPVGKTGVTIPESVTYISGGAFIDCAELSEVNIPNSVTGIGDEAFKECSGLKSVTLPDSIASIGFNMFFKCTSLTEVTIPNSVTAIDENAFMYCSALTSVTIPDSVKSIGLHAFHECTSLKEVTIPASVEEIGSEAFGFSFEGEGLYVEGFKINCYSATAGEKYAKENGFEHDIL